MSRFALALVAFCGALSSSRAAEPELTAEDAKYLDALVADFLFDPTGAERVTGEFPYYSVWGQTGKLSRDGWLVRGPGGNGSRVYFTDGESEPAPGTLTGVDFVTACKARYAARPEKETPEETEERMKRSAGVNGQSNLVLAAWLHKLRRPELAARALSTARKTAADRAGGGPVPNLREALRYELAENAFVDLVDAYMNRGDEVALAHGTRLFKLYRDVAREHSLFQQAEPVLGELQRRQRAGRFGPDAARLGPSELPADPQKRIAALIGTLDEVDVRQWSQPGGVYMGRDWRVQALIECGEAAVPALLAAYETDTRLTRSVQFGRSHFSYRDVLPVRDAVLLAIEGVLRVSTFEPTATGSPHDFVHAYSHQQRVAALRRYWRAYGTLPFDERMMKILTDPRSNEAACREAAANLARLGHGRPTGWLAPLFANPAVKKFASPTAAAAILAVLDRDWKLAYKVNKDPAQREYATAAVEAVYLDALVGLGDDRAAPVLAARARTTTDTNARRRLAFAAFRLGEPGPLNELAKAFEAGTLTVRPPDSGNHRFGYRSRFKNGDDLDGLVRDLSATATAPTDRALFALSDPKHPYHRAARERLVRACDHWNSDDVWLAHPFWFAIARQMLDDQAETGRVYKIENGWLSFSSSNGSGSSGLPDSLTDPKMRRDQVAEKAGDRIATKLADSLAGLPAFHPLRTDSELAMKSIKETLDRFHARLRLLTHEESVRLGMSGFNRNFIPDIKPLNRAATFADVTAGDAVFHLNGKGERAAVALPAWVTLKDESCGLAVQAEVGPDGATVYGVIFKRGMRTVSAQDVDKVEPVEKK